jgi:putative tryptophan/tyrosine transport system substrate-binding protein
MDRRRFLLTSLAGALAGPSSAGAQQAGKIPRLCFLESNAGLSRSVYSPFFQGLRDLGYVDGQTITIDYLSADGQVERFPTLAADCVRLKADIVVASTTLAAQAAKKATRTIPIVMNGLGDPVAAGLVVSIPRPGRNVTGVSMMSPGLAAKRLELLKEMLPRLSRVLVLSDLGDSIAAPQLQELEHATHSLGVTLLVRDIRSADDLPAAFNAGAKERAEGLLTTAETRLSVYRDRVLELAARHRLPGMYPYRGWVAAGGLIAYSSYTANLQARTAYYVDKILKGAKPGDLPVEQPTKFELVINLKTAKALGLTIPPSLLQRADQIIE